MLSPLKATAVARAAEADPNQGRCVVENCPKERGVQAMHALHRGLSGAEPLMDSLEFSWNLRRRSLNLDTRFNLLFVGQSLAIMYSRGCWGLLPEEAVIGEFMSRWDLPVNRSEFPALSPPFTYTLLPIYDMENVGITRQNECPPSSRDSFTVHTYPFKTLPSLQSHIQPHFAIASLGNMLYNRSIVTQPKMKELVDLYPRVSKIFSLFAGWTMRARSPEMLEICLQNKTYAPPSREENEVDHLASESDGDSICTVPRRIKEKKKPSRRSRRAGKRARSASPDNSDLTKKKLRDHENAVEPNQSSLDDKISAWARKSEELDDTSPPTPPRHASE